MIIYDKITGKSKGYGFIEYENDKDMHCKLLNHLICKYNVNTAVYMNHLIFIRFDKKN